MSSPAENLKNERQTSIDLNSSKIEVSLHIVDEAIKRLHEVNEKLRDSRISQEERASLEKHKVWLLIWTVPLYPN